MKRTKVRLITHKLSGLYAFLSTPKFIKSLSDISLSLSEMKNVQKDEKLRILKSQLKKINKYLPASVYIPFVQSMT
jgi:hypothetical protein